MRLARPRTWKHAGRPFLCAWSDAVPAHVLSLQDEALSQVKSILGCSTTTARALLIFFSWDAEAVLGTPVAGWAVAALTLALSWRLAVLLRTFAVHAVCVAAGPAYHTALLQRCARAHKTMVLCNALQARLRSGGRRRCTNGRGCSARRTKRLRQQLAAAAAARCAVVCIGFRAGRECCLAHKLCCLPCWLLRHAEQGELDLFPHALCCCHCRSPAWCACAMWRQQRPPPWSAATPSAMTAGASTCGECLAGQSLVAMQGRLFRTGPLGQLRRSARPGT